MPGGPQSIHSPSFCGVVFNGWRVLPQKVPVFFFFFLPVSLWVKCRSLKNSAIACMAAAEGSLCAGFSLLRRVSVSLVMVLWGRECDICWLNCIIQTWLWTAYPSQSIWASETEQQVRSWRSFVHSESFKLDSHLVITAALSKVLDSFPPHQPSFTIFPSLVNSLKPDWWLFIACFFMAQGESEWVRRSAGREKTVQDYTPVFHSWASLCHSSPQSNKHMSLLI